MLRPKKSLGQNFLKNPRILARIAATAELTPNDHVVEIGPGLGYLTQILAQDAQKVTAVEFDAEIIPKLKENLAARPETGEKIEIIHQDILKFQPPKTPYKLVGNIPYYITSPILSRFLRNEWQNPKPNPPKLIVLTIQKEVAEKICVTPGHSSVLALEVQIFGQPEIILEISRKHFRPIPKVNSALIKITPHPKPLIPPSHLKRAFALIHACFAQRRKQILNPLAGHLQLDKKTVTQALQKIGLDPTTRPQTLTIENWHQLAQHFS